MNASQATTRKGMSIEMGNRDRLNGLVTRRAFPGFAGKGAGVIALGGLVSLREPSGKYIRPRGALPENEFLSICIRCDRCRDACPYGLITIVPLTESIVSAGTPRLDVYCSRCQRCINACPARALVYNR